MCCRLSDVASIPAISWARIHRLTCTIRVPYPNLSRRPRNASAQGRGGNIRDFSSLYSRLFPAMLQLATDADTFARQLFEPLTLQVTSWLPEALPY